MSGVIFYDEQFMLCFVYHNYLHKNITFTQITHLNFHLNNIVFPLFIFSMKNI